MTQRIIILVAILALASSAIAQTSDDAPDAVLSAEGSGASGPVGAADGSGESPEAASDRPAPSLPDEVDEPDDGSAATPEPPAAPDPAPAPVTAPVVVPEPPAEPVEPPSLRAWTPTTQEAVAPDAVERGSAGAWAQVTASEATSTSDSPAWTTWEPDRHELRIWVGGASTVVRDEGFSVFSSDSDVLSGTAYGIQARVLSGLVVGVRGFGATASDSVFQVTATSLRVRGVDVRGRWDFDLVPFVRPYIKADLGVRHAVVEVDDGGLLDDSAVAPSFGAAGGLEVYYPGRHVSVGIFHEHGYRWTGAMSFDGASYGDGSGLVDLGDLTLRGREFATGLFIGAHY